MAGSILNELSSLSALSLARPEAIATLVTLGVVGASAIVAISYHSWEKYEEKKHKEKILAVNRLHRQLLQNLQVNGTPIQGLPQIFQFSADGKTVDSLHYNEDEIKDIGLVLPNVPVVLTRYRHSILDAILKLKEFYFDLDKEDDVSAGVLSYLMNILQNRCLSFVGYDYDITYLNAIISFVNKYASQENNEKSVLFNRLSPVFTSLSNAVQDLIKHKESMSLHELVEETRNTCLDQSNKLVRLLVKMVIPEKYQHLANTVSYEELEADILRAKNIEIAKWGIVFKSQQEIELPQAIFNHWIVNIAKYYLLSLNSRPVLCETKIIRPQEFFAFTNWAKTIGKTSADVDKKKLEDELDLIHKVFTHSPNFINSKLDTQAKKSEFVIVNQNKDLIAATETMAQFAHLTHSVISLQALCAELSTSIEQLGLDFFDVQSNFDKIFDALNTIYEVIQTDLQQMNERMIAIAEAHQNQMRIASKMQFEAEVKATLYSIKSVLECADKIRIYKNKHPHTVEISEQEALSAAEFFKAMYQSKTAKPTTSVANPPGLATSKKKNPPPSPPKTTLTFDEMKKNLTDLSNRLFLELSKIQSSRNPDPQINQYKRIGEQFQKLENKTLQLLQEKKTGPDRINKAHKLYKLTVSLYELTIPFLAQTTEKRTADTKDFIASLHAKLTAPQNNAFIDRHNHSFPKFIYENFGLFKTDTRNKLTTLEEVCNGLLHKSLIN